MIAALNHRNGNEAQVIEPMRTGKRMKALHEQPKTATMKGQIETLDNLAAKYQALLAIERSREFQSAKEEQEKHVKKT